VLDPPTIRATRFAFRAPPSLVLGDRCGCYSWLYSPPQTRVCRRVITFDFFFFAGLSPFLSRFFLFHPMRDYLRCQVRALFLHGDRILPLKSACLPQLCLSVAVEEGWPSIMLFVERGPFPILPFFVAPSFASLGDVLEDLQAHAYAGRPRLRLIFFC